MVRDRMRTQFMQLGLGDRVTMARVVLTRNSELLIVILENEGLRFHVLSTGDRRELDSFEKTSAQLQEEATLANFLGGYRSSVMRCGPHDRLAELVERAEFKALKRGTRHALVYEGQKLVGVLTEEAINEYRERNRGATKGPLAVDTRLAGGMKVELLIKDGKKRYYYNRHK